MSLGFAGRDDSNDIAFRSAAVADDEQSQAAARAEQDKSVFFGVIRVVNQLGVLICEHSLRVLEAHAVLAQVSCRPLNAEFGLIFKFYADDVSRIRAGHRPCATANPRPWT
jgi:hypothetical protein